MAIQDARAMCFLGNNGVIKTQKLAEEVCDDSDVFRLSSIVKGSGSQTLAGVRIPWRAS